MGRQQIESKHSDRRQEKSKHRKRTRVVGEEPSAGSVSSGAPERRPIGIMPCAFCDTKLCVRRSALARPAAHFVGCRACFVPGFARSGTESVTCSR